MILNHVLLFSLLSSFAVAKGFTLIHVPEMESRRDTSSEVSPSVGFLGSASEASSTTTVATTSAKKPNSQVAEEARLFFQRALQQASFPSSPVQPPVSAPANRPPVSAPVNRPPVSAPINRPPVSAPYARPPVSAPVKPPVSAPVKSPVSAPVTPPVSPPVNSCTYKCPAHSKPLSTCPQSFAQCVCSPGFELDEDEDECKHIRTSAPLKPPVSAPVETPPVSPPAETPPVSPPAGRPPVSTPVTPPVSPPVNSCTYRCPHHTKPLSKCPQSFSQCVCKPGWEPDPDGDPWCKRIPTPSPTHYKYDRRLRGA